MRASTTVPTTVSVASARSSTFNALLADVGERLRVIIVAGIPLGVLVGGVVGRLAMGILRVTSPDHVVGVTSDDGFEIGQVTLAGTYSLVGIGAAAGLIGVAAYRAVAPWLIGPSWFRGLTTAAGSGAVVGSMLLHADGVDFTLLGPTWLAIGLFVALPALFGAVVGPVVDRVAGPGSWTRRPWLVWLLPVALVACFPPIVVLVVVAAAILAVWSLLREEAREAGGRRPVALLVRGAWLAVAVLGLVSLVGDIRAIA